MPEFSIGYQDNPAKSGMVFSCQNAAVLAKSATLLFERLLRVPTYRVRMRVRREKRSGSRDWSKILEE